MTHHLHAPDQMGEAAHLAAMCVTGLDADLLTACGVSEQFTKAQRAEAVGRAFRKWMPLCRAMAELQQAAPNAFRKAQQLHDQIRDLQEARG